MVSTTRKNILPEDREKVLEALAKGISSKTIKKDFALSTAQLSYYKRQLENWQPKTEPKDDRLKMAAVKKPNELTSSILKNFDCIKKKNKSMELKDPIPLIQNDSKNETSPSLPDKENTESIVITNEENSFKIFEIDGIELVVPSSAKRIVIRPDKVIVER